MRRRSLRKEGVKKEDRTGGISERKDYKRQILWEESEKGRSRGLSALHASPLFRPLIVSLIPLSAIDSREQQAPKGGGGLLVNGEKENDIIYRL